MATLNWWACNPSRVTQKFVKVDKVHEKKAADFNKVRFNIQLALKGKRVVTVSKEKNGKDFVLKLG
jgi:hypothetical protein